MTDSEVVEKYGDWPGKAHQHSSTHGESINLYEILTATDLDFIPHLYVAAYL
jgi:hypothetical protein